MKKLLWFLSLLFCACVTGPKYQKPAIDAPTAYKEAGAEWKLAAPKDQVLRGKWWELYNDPQLNSLIEQVNVSNQTIAASLANVRQAKALIKTARAQYYPNLSLSPSATRQKGISGPSGPTATNSTTYNLFSIPLEASWVPDLWGRVQNTVRQNVANAQLSVADLENVRLAQQAELATSYYELRAQDELIQLFDSTIEAYKNSLNLTQTLSKTGLGSDEAVAQAESQLRTTQAQGTNLRIARAQFEHAIALLVGKPASSFSLPPGNLQVTPPNIPLSLPSQLLERRPDIAAAERSMASANATIGIATSAYYPQLSLTGAIGYNSDTVENLIKTPNLFWSLGATLSETLFDGGSRSATVEQYTALYDQTVANYRQTVLTAFQQVEDALVSSRVLVTQREQQDQAVASSERFLKIATSRFQLGLDPYLNVLLAQLSVLGNQQAALNVRTQQLTSSVKLIEALGGGWDQSQLPDEKKLLETSYTK